MMILFESPAARPVTLAPRIVLAEPVIIHAAVLSPRTVLLEPDIKFDRVFAQRAVLLLPVALLLRLNEPIDVLPFQLVFERNADSPIAILY